jgi:hypothetical protein
MPSKLTSSTRQTKQVPSCQVADELTRPSERLLERRRKQAPFRDLHKTLDNFDFNFNQKMNGSLVFDMAQRRLHRPTMKMPCFSVRLPGTSPELRN